MDKGYDLSKRDKLDYKQLVGLQVERVNQCFADTYQVCDGGGGIQYASKAGNAFASLKVLESFVVPKFRKEARTKYLAERARLGFDEVEFGTSEGADFDKILKYYELLMKYLDDSDLLPGTRETFSSGRDD